MKIERLICILCGFIFLFIVGCGPSAENPDIIHLGESCEIYKYGECIATISYDDYSVEILVDQVDSVLIVETITITPASSIQLYINDFLLGLGYEFYNNDEDKYQTSVEYNIEKNQCDIFEKEVKESVTYQFCFIVPKERNGTRYEQVGVSFLIFHQFSLVNVH